MTNPSLVAAFERMWQHIISILHTKADADHNHDDVYELKGAADAVKNNLFGDDGKTIDLKYLPINMGTVRENLSGAEQSLSLDNNIDYHCADAVTSLTIVEFNRPDNNVNEAWSIHFVAGDTITVTLPASVVWNYGATPVFTPGSEYWLMFVPLLNGKVLGVWNEVEA